MTPNCSEPYTWSQGETFYWCTDGLPNDQRTVFVDPGDLRVDLLCDFTTENLPCTTVSFRGTNSTDPDGDIASWSVDFDDGTVATGAWTTTPPNDVTHEYHPRNHDVLRRHLSGHTDGHRHGRANQHGHPDCRVR